MSGFFNASLVSVGAALSLGSVLVRVYLGRKRPLATAGFGCVALAGAGGMLLGLFPADTNILVMHHIGAVLSFVFGTAGILTLPAALVGIPQLLRRYAFVSGVVSATGLVLLALYFLESTGAKGIAERVTSYPIMLWFLVFGVYLLAPRR